MDWQMKQNELKAIWKRLRVNSEFDNSAVITYANLRRAVDEIVGLEADVRLPSEAIGLDSTPCAEGPVAEEAEPKRANTEHVAWLTDKFAHSTTELLALHSRVLEAERKYNGVLMESLVRVSRINELEAELARVKGLKPEEPMDHISCLRQEAFGLTAELKTSRKQLADLHVRHQELHENYEARSEMISELKAALRNTEAELEATKGCDFAAQRNQLARRVDELEGELKQAKNGTLYRVDDIRDLKAELAKAKLECRVGNYLVQQVPGCAGVQVWFLGPDT